MVSFYGLALGNAGDYRRELLSCTVFEHLSLAVEAAGGRLYLAAEESGGCEASPADFRARVGGGQCLLLLAPAGALSAETLQRLVNQAEPACLMAGREPLALFGPADAVLGADLSALPGELAQGQTPPGEGIVVTGAESAYAVQEQLRRRINMAWMAKGVMLVDPNTTHAILTLIKDINKKLGITVVVITHQMSVVEEICDHVAILDGGVVVEEGSVQEIFSNPKTPAAKRLVAPNGGSAARDLSSFAPDDHVVRVTFNGSSTAKPLVASLAAEKGILVSVLSADTRDLRGQCYGSMLLKLPADVEQAKQAAAYMRAQPGITVEEVTGE